MKNMINYILVAMLFTLFFAGCERSSGSSTSEVYAYTGPELPVEEPAMIWSVFLTAEASTMGLKTVSPILGALESHTGAKEATLLNNQANGLPYIDIVFINPPIQDVNGTYLTSFQEMNESVQLNWDFTVRLADEDNLGTDANVTLSFNGLDMAIPYVDSLGRDRFSIYRSLTNPRLKMMKFVDTVTGNEIPAVYNDEKQSYTFSMKGSKERKFTWILQTEDINISNYVTSHSVVEFDPALAEERREQNFTFDPPN